MKLYTLLLHFEDRRVWIDQYLTSSPKDALMQFIEKAECLEEYNRPKLLSIVSKRKELFIHLAMWIRWVWIMDFWTDLIDVEEFSDIYGWYIIQSDIDWPIRE